MLQWLSMIFIPFLVLLLANTQAFVDFFSGGM